MSIELLDPDNKCDPLILNVPKSFINLLCIHKFETGANIIIMILLSLVMIVVLAILWKSRTTMFKIT